MCSRFGDLSSSSRRLICKHSHSQELTLDSISIYWNSYFARASEWSDIGFCDLVQQNSSAQNGALGSLPVLRGSPHIGLQDRIEKLHSPNFFLSCSSSALPSGYMLLHMMSCISYLTLWSQMGYFSEFWQGHSLKVLLPICLQYKVDHLTTLPYFSEFSSLLTYMPVSWKNQGTLL